MVTEIPPMPPVKPRLWADLSPAQKRRVALRLFGRSKWGREAAAVLLGKPGVFRQSNNAEFGFIQDPETI